MRKSDRPGAVLTLLVLLIFALIAIAALLIDIGMARLAQTQMQGITDAAAVEGSWQLAIDAESDVVREQTVRRAAELTQSALDGSQSALDGSQSALDGSPSNDQPAFGWGSHRLEFITDEDGNPGFDLDDDQIFESAQTIDRDTLGTPIRPTLDPNVDNALEGDMVIGNYDTTAVPNSLPGQPIGYDRGPAFTPSSDGRAILVRARRTGEIGLEGGTSAERLVALWGRGSLLDFGIKGRGISVRSESIADLRPVLWVGPPGSGIDRVIEAMPLSISTEAWQGDLSAPVDLTPIDLDEYAVGTEIDRSGNASDELVLEGYLSITSLIAGQQRIVGFSIARVTRQDPGERTWLVEKLSLPDSSFPDRSRLNATANAFLARRSLSSLTVNDRAELFQQQSQISDLARAPRLVRSQQIQGVLP